MTISVGINGLGRIGRQVLKICSKNPDINIVGVNELNPDIDNWCYTLNFDSIYGKLNDREMFKRDGSSLSQKNMGSIFASHHVNIVDAPWSSWGAEYVIDCTGVKANVLKAREVCKVHGLKNLFISHSPEEKHVDLTMILGVNHNEYNPLEHKVIASSICDATAIAPVTKIIDENFSINSGYVTTLHPWLSYQNLLDGASSSWSVPGEIYHHFALGRSSVNNIIPKPTSAMEAVFKVLPNLDPKKIGSFSYRMPTSIIASADMTFCVDKNATQQNLFDAFAEYKDRQEFPVIKLDNSPLTSVDYISEDYSCVIDFRWLNAIANKVVKVVLWYDNEYGYSSNLVRQLLYVAGKNSLS
ncbi:aldehyde dehydrogenase [bacterium]|nr:aldehyde dehydrogenase [bacterium]